jgi:hypothetical protein
VRDPLRITRIMNKLKAVWSHPNYTDMRFGQLLECITPCDRHHLNWNMEDDQFEQLLETWYRRIEDEEQRYRDMNAL